MASRNYLTVNLRGTKPAQDWIASQVRRIKDFSPALEKISTDYYDVQREWFESQGGGRWRPLNPRYAARKAKRAPGKTILRLTDRLYNEITGKNRKARTRKSGLQIYILGVPYWVEHEEGRPNMNLPQREVISPWIAQRVKTWNDMLTQHLSIDFFTDSRR